MVTTLLLHHGKVAGRDLPLDDLKQTWAETPQAVVWIDLSDPTVEEVQAVLEGVFGFHPLTIEDCLTETPYPRLEDYGEYAHLVVHAVEFDRVESFRTSELDLFIARNFLVTFHRRRLGPIDTILDRVTRHPAIARQGERLAHAILDLLVEDYKPVLAEIRSDLEEVEEEVVETGGTALDRIVTVRQEVAHLRRLLRPQRLVLNRLASGTIRAVRPKQVPWFRDLADDLGRLEEQTANWQDQLVLLFRLQLNRTNRETNDGIRILTALTALGFPLFLLGTWFSMNFEDMPLLDSPHAYAATIFLTLAATASMALWLRKRGLL